MSNNPEDFNVILPQNVTFNGAQVPIEIEPEAGGLSQPQQEALRILLALPSNVLQTAAPAVVQNYEVYREAIGDDELPPLAHPVDVWQSVTPTSFTIPAHGTLATPTFFLQAECDWDPEHGLTVRFRNGHADAADQQGELGLED